jgi:hypothetical protein
MDGGRSKGLHRRALSCRVQPGTLGAGPPAGSGFIAIIQCGRGAGGRTSIAIRRRIRLPDGAGHAPSRRANG